MRVFPPPELKYPDIKSDGLDFYDKIGCPKLKIKYAPKKISKLGMLLKANLQEVKADTGNDGMNELMRGVSVMKLKTTARIQRVYLNKLNWNMCEVKYSDLGKVEEPKKQLISSHTQSLEITEQEENE